ncbi:AAA domain-containing protein [Paramuribaculum intestinale]|uniref:AAA domain-containing protein n=1 Tax=Paramuribaculum intestinale TaxID=2094151 RepID=UPI0025B0686F|nr:AAA domain-containing protein [Paramuribaculum intestinale]
MRLIDLAKKCGAEIKEIVRTIEVQFHEALPHEPNIHVPDQYISRILYMYETLQPHLFNKGYIPEDDSDKAIMLQSSTPDLERSIETSTDAKDINEEISIPQCPIVPLPDTEPLLEHNILSPAKTFGSGNDQLIKLYKIARDLNISVFTIVEAFSHVFQGNTNPNSRVSRNLAIQIYNYFGKEYNDANEITAPNCNSIKDINIGPDHDDATDIVKETFYNDSDLRTSNNEDVNQECFYSIANLSLRMGIAEGRVRNILPLLGYSDTLGSHDEIITLNNWEKIIEDYNSVSPYSPKSNQEGKHLQRITALGLNSLNKPNVVADLQSAYDSHQITEAKITAINSGGYVMTSIGKDYNILFCPYSHSVASISGSKLCKRLIGSSWLIEVKSNPSENNGNIIVSARLNKKAYSGLVKEAGFYEAFICNCTEYGAYVLIEKCVPMFIPNKLISWKNTNNAQTDLKPGESVVVKILKGDKGLIASIRDAFIDPWIQVPTVYPVGTVVETSIIQKEEGYVLIDLGDYTGYLPASDISWVEFIRDCRDYSFPDSLRVVVTGYNDKKRTIQVSVKRLSPDPWTELDKHLPEGEIVTAEITELTNTGAKLKVGDVGFSGYLSYRDVDWCRNIDKTNFPYEIGDLINVKVAYRNTAKRRLTCSIKALSQNPWEELIGVTSIEGRVLKVEDDHALVRLENGIELDCKEKLNAELEGQDCTFNILTVNAASQHLSISYRKHEIIELNTLAVGEMFKKFRSISNDEKTLTEAAPEEYRKFIVKEVSSTGRVTAFYAEDDGEYENGILLPGAVTINDKPINVIFARQIIKKHILPKRVLTFRVTHRYDTINYAVLAIDATPLLKLDKIAKDDMSLLSSLKGIDATVLHNLTTSRNIFVEYNGYFGYIPRAEIAYTDEELPEELLVRAISMPPHPQQMIRFTVIDKTDVSEECEDENLGKEEKLKPDSELFDCYSKVNGIKGFNPKQPDYYPLPLQIRYDSELFKELDKLLSSDPNFLVSQTFFLDCYRINGGTGHIVSIFNNSISIQAFCSERQEGDEIHIKKCVVEPADTPKIFSKPLRISGENIQIVPLNSSAPAPSLQDADIIENLLLYNQVVLPELRKLTHEDMAKRGEHYLTLKEMLKLDIEREEELSTPVIPIKTTDIREDAGTLGGLGIVFSASENEFDTIRSKDDSQEGFFVYLKPDDGSDFDKTTPDGRMSYIGNSSWRVDLYKDKDIYIEALKKFGIQVKRRSNVRHLKKQIRAIDDFVFERNGLDIFSKIVRKKLKPVIAPPISEIEANAHFRLDDSADSQANALKMALGGSEITLIQGPPGTGKSTVIIDIIRNLVKQHKKVLVCAQSVAPIEELYFKLSGRRKGISINKPVMVEEHPLRCAYLKDDESIEISGSVDEQRKALKEVMLLINRLKEEKAPANPIAVERLKLSEFFENSHKEECNHIRSRFESDILPEYDRIEDILSEYINALNKEDVENFASEQKSLNLEAVDVVFGTCIGVGVSRLLEDTHFDTLIIDEAGKANYAESLVPMLMANEFILVGDDKQLPPYTNMELVKKLVLNQRGMDADDIEEEELNTIAKDIIDNEIGKSFFADIKQKLNESKYESNITMLSKQFRMHPAIGEFVSKLFYNGKVDSARTASERTLNIKGLEEPIIFVDTSGMGSEARETRQSMSLYNDGEIRAIEEELLPMLKSALDAGASIGILSPYGAQVSRMRQRFPELKNHIFTIDSIQGEEYDVVVFSFVRNTQFGSLNFVDDLRRLNVSFSRAKCNLIMVGHLDTLKNESVHKVDHEAVMAVYNEIQSKRVKTIVHHGAMQCLYNNFPPESHPLVQDLDKPYCVFEDCRPTGKPGEFTVKYGENGGQLLTLFNPMLQLFHKKTPKDEWPQSFKASLIGFFKDTPYTVIEPMGFWLQGVKKMESFDFSATVVDSSQSKVTLQLHDLSFVSLPVPSSLRLSIGSEVKIVVKNNYKFTIKPLGHE